MKKLAVFKIILFISIIGLILFSLLFVIPSVVKTPLFSPFCSCVSFTPFSCTFIVSVPEPFTPFSEAISVASDVPLSFLHSCFAEF